MYKMGVMHTATEKKNDPPPSSQTPHSFSSQEAGQFKHIFFLVMNISMTLLIFICKIVVDNVYVELNETSPMLL